MRCISIGLAGALSFTTTTLALDSLSWSRDVELDLNSAANQLWRGAASQPFMIHAATTPNLFSPFFHHFDTRQAVGRCGTSGGGARCPDNQCCSTFDYCGTDNEHCALLVGCQPQYGRCGDAAPEPTPTPTPSPTPSPLPPPSSTVFPPTPSSTLIPTISSVLPPLPSGTLIVSPNGQCGNLTTCGGSGFGSCCSEWYFCGSGPQYCGTGCRSEFGTCNGAPPPISSSNTLPPSSSSIRTSSTPPPVTTSTPTPTPTTSPTSSLPPAVPTNVSTDGRCGAEGSGRTCQGSAFGRCCSDYGWCGSSDDHCRPAYGCRPDFGTCG
ncbi:hypothetical protein BDU57DRAFT_341723 [Ampelomyces quisqualis]|uniref:Chitin-binding type-1 domain-containing protein n=1 Tax=Ampelomyces quisqualis TaxID=50730 RepID=A0A6A5QFY7_AMPQU|nr:hypothetical protein BDU57DRAFT_341723 [Ampelomyces quisqualis]